MGFFSQDSSKDICEIRWHGRGGQGAITSAQYLAQAAFLNGFKGVTSAPSFGAERRGAPVTASTRISHTPLRMFSQVESPDGVIVLDETLLECDDPTAGLSVDGWIILNTHRAPDSFAFNGGYSVATADATGIAQACGLVVAGSIMVNTAMLGAIACATGLVTLDGIRETLEEKYSKSVAAKNFEVAKKTFEQTQVWKPAARPHRPVMADRVMPSQEL